MEKTKDSVKQLIKEQYEKACNAYVDKLLTLFEVDKSDCWWVAEEVGGVFIVGDMLSLNMQDIVYIVDNDIPYDDCCEWQDYNWRADEFHFNAINIKSWHMGAPRVPQEVFDKLRKMKEELNNLVEETRNKY